MNCYETVTGGLQFTSSLNVLMTLHEPTLNNIEQFRDAEYF